MERSSLLVTRGAKPWRRRTLEGSSGSPAVLRGSVVTFGLEDSEAVAGACSRGL